MRGLLLVTCALATLFGGTPARADESSATTCGAAFQAGQVARRKGAFGEARAELLVCSREPCSEAIRPTCARWLAEVDHAMPSLVVSVRSARGEDVRDARVSIDGELVAERLDGRAMDLDPGDHDVRVEVGGEIVDRHVVVVEGEKARVLAIELAERPAPPPPPEVPPPPPLVTRPVPVLTWVFGGFTLAGLGVFTGFGVAGNAGYADMERCRPACSPDLVDDTQRSYLVADLGLGVAVVGLGLTVASYLLRPTVTTERTAGAR